MSEEVREFLPRVGREGGRERRRTLDPATAQAMVRVGEARRAYRRFHSRCFWSYPKELTIGADDVTWVAETLMKHGDREAWDVGYRLCR